MSARTGLKTLRAVVVGTAAVALGFSSSARAASLYTVTAIGPFFGGPVSSRADDINAAGQIVGTYGNPARPISGFLWDPTNGIQDLGNLFGENYSLANAINDAGLVVGQSVSGIPSSRAVLWDANGDPQRLPTFLSDPTNDNSVANDINNQGQTVGVARSSQGDRAVLWENDRIIDLGIAGEATAINELGWIAGNATNGGAFLWQNNQVTDLGALESAEDLNDRGQVVGSSTCNNTLCAFLWDNGLLTPLGEFRTALGINNLGWVVGYAAGGSSLESDRALLWENGVAIDLNTRIDPSLGWTLYQATAINDKGQIVGLGKAPDPTGAGGSFNAFLLTPVAEPASTPESSLLLGLILTGVGLGLLGRHRH